MATKCALESVSCCGNYLPKADHKYYNAKELESIKVTNLFPKLSRDTFFADFSEKWLIEHRSGIELKDGDFVCAKHKYSFGEKWKPLKRCYHPDHVPNVPSAKKQKVSGLRPSSSDQYKLISKVDPSFPLFATLCRHHEKTANVLENTTETDETDKSNDLDVTFEQTSDLEQLNSVLNTLDVPSVRCVIDAPVESLSKKFLDSKRQKFQKAIQKLKNLFAAIAPGQEDKFKNLLFSCEEDNLQKHGELKAFQKIYDAEDSDKRKMRVISCIDRERFSRQEIQDQLGCSRSTVTKARKMVT